VDTPEQVIKPRHAAHHGFKAHGLAGDTACLFEGVERFIDAASPSSVEKGQLRKGTSLGWPSERVEPKATVVSAFSEAR